MSPPSEKVEGHLPRVPQQIAPVNFWNLRIAGEASRAPYSFSRERKADTHGRSSICREFVRECFCFVISNVYYVQGKEACQNHIKKTQLQQFYKK